MKKTLITTTLFLSLCSTSWGENSFYGILTTDSYFKPNCSVADARGVNWVQPVNGGGPSHVEGAIKVLRKDMKKWAKKNNWNILVGYRINFLGGAYGAANSTSFTDGLQGLVLATATALKLSCHGRR